MNEGWICQHAMDYISELIRLENEHKAQVINYLKAMNKEIGLLINFGKSSLQWERISIFGLTK